MSANVENMFYVREKPWHGLGVQVMEAPLLPMLLSGLALTGGLSSVMSAPTKAAGFPATRPTSVIPTAVSGHCL